MYIYKRSLVLQVQNYRRSPEAKGKEPKASSHALQLPEAVTCSLRKGAQWESALSLLSASWLVLPVHLLGVWAWWGGFSRVFGVLGGLGFGELGELEHAWSFEGFVRNCLVRSSSRVDDTV